MAETATRTYRDIVRMTGIKLNTLRVWVNRGKMPEPTRHEGYNFAVWDAHEIDPWIRENGGEIPE